MKKILLSFVFFFGIIWLSFSQGIIDSAHDFSTETWNSTTELCIVCHTPHNSAALTDAPLWNHDITTTTFTLYSSATLDATIGQPNATSKLCLSCHDGTVAVDNFGGTTTGNDFISGTDLLGTDISNDHPISFIYDASLAATDGSLFDPTIVSSGLVSTINDDMLFNSQMQCASCHDVHNTGGFTSLLIKNNTNSALCLTCHNK